MITTKTISDELNRGSCQGIDEFIEKELKPRFSKEGFYIYVTTEVIESKGWIGYEFVRAMKFRGFDVEAEYCKTLNHLKMERYLVSIPPQEE